MSRRRYPCFLLIVSALTSLISTSHHARASTPMRRFDVGVAVVDTRTGKVLWEVWRRDEAPEGLIPEGRAAVDYLLSKIDLQRVDESKVTLLPTVPVEKSEFNVPWPKDGFTPWPEASEGKNLIYVRHASGVIAFDRQSKKEVWQLGTTLIRSKVLEAGENLAFIHIGSIVPHTLSWSLAGQPKNQPLPGIEPVTVRQRVAAAMLLHHYGDGYFRPEVRKIADQLRDEKNEPAAGPAAKAVEKLLATWPKTRDWQRLLDGTVAALLHSERDNPLRDYPWPGGHRILIWSVLQELIYGWPIDGYSPQGVGWYARGWRERTVSLPDATRAKLADHCRQVGSKGPEAEKPYAASVLLSTAVGWDQLTDSERKRLFLSSNPSAWRWAALALAKNGRREQLIAWAGERPPDDHLDVLWVLDHDRPKELSDKELAFWLACARRSPGGVAYIIRYWEPIPTEFREPIRKYLQTEITDQNIKDQNDQRSGELFSALRVLDSWQNPDDTPLLLEYLKHPYPRILTRYPGPNETVIRDYQIRHQVRLLLEKRGAKIPFGIVYQEVVWSPK